MKNLGIHPYQGRKAVLATKHGKEQAVAPPLMASIGLEVCTPPDLDTDLLGTFSGEIVRQGTAEEVAFRKARLGMAATGLPLGLANEGSFGPHPQLGVVAGDHELLVFVDDELGLEIREGLLTTETNFAHQEASAADQLSDFLARVRFPSHGVIVRPNSGLEPGLVFKGITVLPALDRAVDRCARASADGLAHVETDMRANMNPTRHAIIGQLAGRLARRLATRCAHCGSPGWGVVGVVRGLPCEWCGAETDWVRQEIFGCPRCQVREYRPRSDGRDRADPGNCPECNP